MANYSGGYLQLNQPLLKTGLNKHTAGLEDPVSDDMLAAVNWAQRTKWRVNSWINRLMTEAIREDSCIGGLPSFKELIVERRELTDEQWAALSSEEKTAIKHERQQKWDSEMTERGRRASLLRVMQVAEELDGQPTIWFPHGLDFRGRVYPLPQDLNPQGDQFCKALLEFAEGKSLGERGAYWLMIALANAAGQDKLLFDERIQWVKDNEEHIRASVESPLDYLWWAAVDHRGNTVLDAPWQFLALAKEYVGYLNQGPSYVSHQPIHIDATCSGMQHLSAMGLDEIGGKAVNLMNTGKREDLYSEVAKAVAMLVSNAAAQGDELAHVWVGNVSRSTVKRSVMTTPYGVTGAGIRDQLINDGFCKGLPGNPSKNASWLRDQIIEGLSSTVVAAKVIMKYLQDVANALAQAGLAFEWTTPVGMKVRQAYVELDMCRVSTLYGTLALRMEGDGDLSVRRASLAAAPNFVHSLDAAHLAKTVLACKEHGIKAIALIHDSYGTHACDVDLLGRLLRVEFVKMYSEDLLLKLEEEVKAYAPDVELPERPSRGSLDLSQVLQSPYFFS